MNYFLNYEIKQNSKRSIGCVLYEIENFKRKFNSIDEIKSYQVKNETNKMNDLIEK
jgi:hypothetical protein